MRLQHRIKNRRRLRVIKPRSQWRLIGIAVSAVFAVSAVVTALNFGAFYYHARSIAIGSESAVSATVMLIVQACLAAIAPAAAVAIFTLLITHRIFGPVAVMEHMVSEFAQGKFPKRRSLRKKDELRTLHALICDAVDHYEERANTQQERRKKLRREIEMIQHSVEAQSPSVDCVMRYLDEEDDQNANGSSIGKPVSSPTEASRSKERA